MNKYSNAVCPVCAQPFLENQDIVVCPDCGAPHHRECYQRLGHCACLENHSTGKSWQPPVSETPEPEQTSQMNCPRCSAPNPDNGIFCSQCGARLVSNGSADTGAGGFRSAYPGAMAGGRFGGFASSSTVVEEEMDGVKTKDLEKFVGANSGYFLRIFSQMKKSGRPISWNWPSLFFSWRYMLYRKMYLLAIVVFAVKTLLSIPYSLCLYEEMAIASGVAAGYSAGFDSMLLLANILNAVSSAFSVVIALFFNKLYYRHSVKKIKNIQQKVFVSEHEYAATLAKKGQVNIFIIGFMLMIYTTFGMILLPFLTL